MKSRISMIAAIGATNRALGKSGDLIYKIPEDMKRFGALTKGHPVIMGRKTWESLPKGRQPLPDRTNIVITRNVDYKAPGAIVVSDVEEGLTVAKMSKGADEIFIIGGGDIYEMWLSFADRLYLTLVDGDKEGDAFFPEYAEDFTKEIAREEHPEHVPRYSYVTLERA